MPKTSLESRLLKIFGTAVEERVFPGAVAGISSGPPEKRTVTILPFGKTAYTASTSGQAPQPQEMSEDVFFDLASLTKPLATLLAILCLIKSKKIALSSLLPSLLPEIEIPEGLRQCTLAHLLRHSSGLPAHKPYFTALNKLPAGERTTAIRRWILKENLVSPPGAETLYSDLGYIILGWIVESHSGYSLDQFVQQNVFKPLEVSEQIFFNPGNAPRSGKYAPTELCSWRHKTIYGQVHDDNCYAMGGVAGHAGLFGNITGLIKLTTHLLDVWHQRTTHPNYNSADLKKVTLGNPTWGNTWALGFDTPSPSGSSSGHFLSPQSFGHLGFTGTSLWIDPTINLVIVLLSNRVHPSRNNTKIKKFRRQFHDTILKTLLEEK